MLGSSSDCDNGALKGLETGRGPGLESSVRSKAHPRPVALSGAASCGAHVSGALELLAGPV